MEEITKTILVIDDSSTNILLIEAILNERGYNIKTAFSVKEAYGIMNKVMPDLILLDLLMPKVNGFEFLEEVKKNDATKNIPVIVISAATEIENIKRASELGAKEFVTKPVDLQKVIQLVDTILGTK